MVILHVHAMEGLKKKIKKKSYLQEGCQEIFGCEKIVLWLSLK